METFLFVRSWEVWQRPCLAGIAALTTVLAACGGDSPASPADGPASPGDENVVCVPSGSVAGWRFTRFSAGTKPAIAVGTDGTVHATFMSESMSGWVRYASLSAGASSPGQSELIANGYFYGPIDILLADDGQPRILYHDHDREDPGTRRPFGQPLYAAADDECRARRMVQHGSHRSRWHAAYRNI